MGALNPTICLLPADGLDLTLPQTTFGFTNWRQKAWEVYSFTTVNIASVVSCAFVHSTLVEHQVHVSQLINN